MKFGQLMDYNKLNILFGNHAEFERVRTVPDLYFYFKKSFD